jgi:hypothetical protein
VDDIGVLPRLGEGAVVPEVALVGEAVAHEAELAFLDVLLDGVEKLLLGDLVPSRKIECQFGRQATFFGAETV